MKTTAVILGTSRQGGNTDQLARTVSERIGASFYDLAGYDISEFDYSHQNRSDDFLPLMREVVNHEHIILASPIYWYAPSAKLKIFLDRISDLLTIDKPLGRALRNKRVSTISTGVNELAEACFDEMFKRTCRYLGMEYRHALYCCCSDDDDALIDLPSHRDTIEQFVANWKT